jgi:hypothetical protein
MQALGSGQPTIEDPLSIENILMLVCWPNVHNFIKRKFYIVKKKSAQTCEHTHNCKHT